MTSDTFTKQMDFWHSPSHEAWMLECNEGDYRPIVVEINGVVYDYTTCVKAGNTEPFDDALKKFPDYVKVATGTLHGFRYRSDKEGAKK